MLHAAIEDSLEKTGITADEFSELLIRLMDYGVITRHESQIEAQLYDRYLRCHALIDSYLSLIKVRIQHDRKFCFVRLFPPGATIPGFADDEHSAFNGGFRNRPNQQEIAVILVLRVEYEKALREGLIDDKGQVVLSVESLSLSMSNLIKRQLPDNMSERKQLFKRLRQLRLIHYNSDTEKDGDELWLSIQPAITSFVNEAVLAELIDSDEDNNPEETPAHVL